MSGRPERTFRLACRWIDRLERSILAALVAGMVGLAALQILMRNVFQSGWSWAGDLLGMALLWLTMLGALAATGLGRHLSIDLAAALLPRRWASGLARTIFLIFAVICGLLAWMYIQPLLAQKPYVGMLRLFHYPAIPVVFCLMAFLFAKRAFRPAHCRFLQPELTVVISLFAAVVCVLLAWAAGRYVGFQREMDITMLLGMPVWKYYLVIPVVFWMMAFRFAVRAFVPAAWLSFKDEEGLPGEGRTLR